MDVVDRLFAAIEAGDADGVAACYGPDTVIWHNYTGVEQPAADNLMVLRWLIANVTGIRYEIVRREPLPDGFVQQHVLHGTTGTGAELRVPSCMVIRVDGDRIARIDEYLDSAQLAPLLNG